MMMKMRSDMAVRFTAAACFVLAVSYGVYHCVWERKRKARQSRRDELKIDEIRLTHRLPRFILPVNYDILLAPDQNQHSFEGRVIITVDVKEASCFVALNAVDLLINPLSVEFHPIKRSSRWGKKVQEATSIEEFSGGILVIYFAEPIQPGQGDLCLSFEGKMTPDLKGLHHSTKRRKRKVAFTVFKPAYARMCFPCFDEPEPKAVFKLSVVVREDDYISGSRYPAVLSNMDVDSTIGEDGTACVQFKKTPEMSIDNLAFVIIPLEDHPERDHHHHQQQQQHPEKENPYPYHYPEEENPYSYHYPEKDNTENGTTKDDKRIRVYGSENKELGIFALDVALRALEYYTIRYGRAYDLPKLDLVAVQDLPMTYVENYGILLFRRAFIQVDPKFSSVSQKQRVAFTIAQAVAGQWLLNLPPLSDRSLPSSSSSAAAAAAASSLSSWSTLSSSLSSSMSSSPTSSPSSLPSLPDTWQNSWIKQSFAKWASYRGMDSLFPQWKSWMHFILTGMSTALRMDSLHVSTPLEADANSYAFMENDGVACFRGGGGFEDEDETNTCKGVCLLRMLRYHVGAKKFKQCTDYCMKKNALNSGSGENNFWACFAEMAGGEAAHIKDFMMTWTRQKGYPVISVELLDSHTIRISQSPFATTMGKAGAQTQSLQLWQVPITLCVSSYSSLDQWLLTEQSTTVKLQTPMSYPLKPQALSQEHHHHDDVNSCDGQLWSASPPSPSSSISLSSSLPSYDRETGSFRIDTLSGSPWACHEQQPPSQLCPVHHNCRKQAEKLVYHADDQRSLPFRSTLSSSFRSSLSSSGHSSCRGWRCTCSECLRATAGMTDEMGTTGMMMIKSRSAGNIHNSFLRSRAQATCRERSKERAARPRNKQSSQKLLQSRERLGATERATFGERDRVGLRDSVTMGGENSQRRKHYIESVQTEDDPQTSAEVRERWRARGGDCEPAEKRRSDKESSSRSYKEREKLEGDHDVHSTRDHGCETKIMMVGEAERAIDLTQTARQRSSRQQSTLTYCNVAGEPLTDSHVEKTDSVSEEAIAGGMERCGNDLMKAGMSSAVPEVGTEKTEISTESHGDKAVKKEHRCTERELVGERRILLTRKQQVELGSGDEERLKTLRKAEGDHGETLLRSRNCERESSENLPKAKHGTDLEERAMNSAEDRGSHSYQGERSAELRGMGKKHSTEEDQKPAAADHKLRQRHCVKDDDIADAAVSKNSPVNDPPNASSLLTTNQQKKDEREKEGKGKEKAEDENEEENWKEEQKSKMNKDRKETGKGERNTFSCCQCNDNYTPMTSNFDALCQQGQESQRHKYYRQAHVSCDCWLKVNVRQIGFYRVCYDDELMAHLVNAVKAGQLAPSDKFGILDDCYAFCKSGLKPVSTLISLMQAYAQESDCYVMQLLADICYRLSGIIAMARPSIAQDFNKFACSLFRFHAQRLGWRAVEGEDHLDMLLRAKVHELLVSLGDAKSINEGARMFKTSVADENSEMLPADIQRAAYMAALRNCMATDKSSLADRGNNFRLLLIYVFPNCNLREERIRVLSALATSPCHRMVRKALNFSLTSRVRHRDAVHVLEGVCNEGRETAWTWLKKHWEEIWIRWEDPPYHWIQRFVRAAAGELASDEMASDVEEFFSKKGRPLIAQTVGQVLENIRVNARWVDAIRTDEWLAHQITQLAAAADTRPTAVPNFFPLFPK